MLFTVHNHTLVPRTTKLSHLIQVEVADYQKQPTEAKKQAIKLLCQKLAKSVED